MRPRAYEDREGGFTLMEALAAVAITGAILLALGAVAGQWLPQWRHGFEAVQNADLVAQSLDRIVADLSTAEPAKLDPAAGPPLFRGDENTVMFVRAATGPNAKPQLEYVRIGPAETKTGAEFQRSHAAFAPGPIGPFHDAVAVLRPPFRLTFAYETADGHWRSSWSGGPTLPRAIRLTVFNGKTLATSTAFLLKTASAPDFSAAQAPKTDDGQLPTLQPETPPDPGASTQ